MQNEEAAPQAINLKVMTAFRSEFRGLVSYIEVPSIAGPMGIMPGHMPVICAVSQGTIKAKSEDGTDFTLEIKSGFLKMTGNQCTIMLEEAIPLSESA